MFRKYVNSSLILIIVTIVAMIVANSGWGDAYRSLWEKPVSFSIGNFNLFSHGKESLSLMDFINDFLMALFFFSVGLESLAPHHRSLRRHGHPRTDFLSHLP